MDFRRKKNDVCVKNMMNEAKSSFIPRTLHLGNDEDHDKSYENVDEETWMKEMIVFFMMISAAAAAAAAAATVILLVSRSPLSVCSVRCFFFFSSFFGRANSHANL